MSRPCPEGWDLPEKCKVCQWRVGNDGDYCLLYDMTIWRAWRHVHGCNVTDGKADPNPMIEAQGARSQSRLARDKA